MNVLTRIVSAGWARGLAVALGVAAVFGLVLVILQASAPAPPARLHPPDPGTDPQAASAYVAKLARTHGGDYAHLSADDKTFLDALASGHGRDLLRWKARQLARPGAPAVTEK